jgi:hypothetical protein
VTTWVAQGSTTGRGPMRLDLIGEGALNPGHTLLTSAQADRGEWVRARFQVLGFVGRDSYGWTPTAAANAAVVSLVQWANESSWGANEWRWNAFGMHCGGATECMRFPSDTADPELRAYTDAQAAASDWWARVESAGGTALLAQFARGELGALRTLWDRGTWARVENAESIMGTVRTLIANGNDALYAALPGPTGATSTTGGATQREPDFNAINRAARRSGNYAPLWGLLALGIAYDMSRGKY